MLLNFWRLSATLPFSALMLLVGWQEGQVKTEWWSAGMVIYLQRDADLHLMPLPLSKIHIAFTFLVPAHQGSP